MAVSAPRFRPAGDAAPAPPTTSPTAPAPNNAPRDDAGIQVGRQVIASTTDSIAREQERARQEQEQRAQERLAQIQAQRDIELARIRANAETALAARADAPSLANPRADAPAQFSVLGLEATTAAQNVNARPATTPATDTGVLAWIKENPVPTAIGVAVVVGGIAYYVKQSSKKRRGR